MNYGVKRKVFISYHHRGDQSSLDLFTQYYSDQLNIFYDQSLDGRIRSDDSEYVNRTIREDYIKGSSLTIVLCGAETWKRKYVDWEIYSTLYLKHALLGIALPTAVKSNDGIIVPYRLNENIQSGFAGWLPSWPNTPDVLQSAITLAIDMSRNSTMIRNDSPKMDKNIS